MNDYQKAQREKTIAAVAEAAERLQAKGVKLTIRAIAEEADLSVGAVSKSPVKSFLIQKYQMGEKNTNNDIVIDNLNNRIQLLEKKVKAEHSSALKARAECKRLRGERDSWETKYRELLLRYAIDIDRKITSIK